MKFNFFYFILRSSYVLSQTVKLPRQTSNIGQEELEWHGSEYTKILGALCRLTRRNLTNEPGREAIKRLKRNRFPYNLDDLRRLWNPHAPFFLLPKPDCTLSWDIRLHLTARYFFQKSYLKPLKIYYKSKPTKMFCTSGYFRSLNITLNG